jgi:hypothetical protein
VGSPYLVDGCFSNPLSATVRDMRWGGGENNFHYQFAPDADDLYFHHQLSPPVCKVDDDGV